MSIILNSSGGGSVTINEPSTASNFTQSLPASTGTVLLSSTVGVCKAWVNFAGATGTVNGSFNVSSVTRNSTGNYDVNMTTAMPNANYAIAISCIVGGSGRACYSSTTPTTSVFNVYSTNGASVVDPTQVWAAVFSS